MHRAVELLDLSLATSGDYRNFYEQEGVWISHLIDPRTSQPIQHDLASVSVIHPQAVWADAWATALMVLGPDAGYALAKREELAAYLIVRAGEGTYTTRSTPAFEALVGGAHSSD
jgi:thiamine biosynthesis lipoprotein